MKNVKFFWKTITWGSIILVLSLISGNTVNKMSIFQIPNFDKILHASFYAVFALLLAWDILGFKNKNSRFVISIITMMILLVYGGIIELLQKYLSRTRNADFFDLLANFVGISIGIVLFYLAVNYRINNIKREKY